MNGAGTQESPYVIMNADDLYSVGEVGTDDTYFMLGADIDISFSQSADNFIPITLKCLDFNGNGHMIRNVNSNIPNGNAAMFIISNETENSVVNIHGLVLENIRLIGDDVFLFASADETPYNIRLEYCTFILNEICYLTEAKNVSTTRRCTMHDDSIRISADYCTFTANIDFIRTHAVFSGDTISRSQIKAEISTIDMATIDNNYDAFFSGVTFSDSYFFCNFNRRNTTTTGNMNISSNDCTFSRFYMVFVPLSGVATAYWKGTIATPCFYDISVLKQYLPNAKIETNSSSGSANARNLLGLTTEQCKSAEYLQSVDFDCLEG